VRLRACAPASAQRALLAAPRPTLASIPARCRSLNEVAALFQDLAVLVQHQSEMLDSIEENVEVAGA